jgi:molybdopterin-containing oxidoreductase family iron-sulfur binding subunit
MPLGGFGYPVLAENHMGRPTKLEGNPDHPASLGATEVFTQASVLTLYDPDRSRTIQHLGEVKTWSTFLAAMQALMAAQRMYGGTGFRLLTEPVTSPTLASQIRMLLENLPDAKWHQWDPVYGAAQDGAPAAHAIYRFDRADVILALDADFLGFGPGAVRYTKDFSSRRRMGTPQDQLNRLYVAEPVLTVTGANAEHRLAIKARDIHAFAAAVAAAAGANVTAQPGASGALSAEAQKWAAAVAADLSAHRGRSVVVAGDHQPAVVHALARAINDALGNTSATVTYTAPIPASPADGTASISELVRDMSAGTVEALVILGGNPVFTAPADLKFAEALNKVGLRVHLGLYHDETAELCHWHVPEAHYLESWGDVRAFDGTVSLQQPLVAPLYDGRTALEVIAAMNGMPGVTPMEIVKEFWSTASSSGEWTIRSRDDQPFASQDAFWRNALHDGFIASTSPLGGAPAAAAPAAAESPAPIAKSGLEIVFRPDPCVLDGRFANNAWLQEFPKPLSKVTWDNVAYIGPKLASEHGNLANGDVIDIQYGGATIAMPVWVMPGMADDTIAVHFGYGRRRAGRVGTDIGVNAYVLRQTRAPWFDGGATMARTGRRHPLASTQNHFMMEGRNPVRVVDVEAFRANPDAVQSLGHNRPAKTMTLYQPDHPHMKGEHQWGMAIDLNACTGCQACVIACTAENNIPVVGKAQVERSREMHWLRVDTYFEGDPQTPSGTYHQPMPCQQCENAPCEVVCPVAATVHSDEGLNDMVYNRCVGTRYCSNNCPYKVRRFNFMLYSDFTTPELFGQRNPDVTIRSRGVMEKCTYCVQRINLARVDARTEDRPIRDGEIRTACQQVCPADAIVFGDVKDSNSQVSKLKAQTRNYGILEDLNTRPRTSYLAVVRNPNPGLARSAQG